MVAIAKLLCLALTATAASVVRRDIFTIRNDIVYSIYPQVTKLYSDIRGFPASGTAGTATIKEDFTALIATLKQATANIYNSEHFDVRYGDITYNDILLLSSGVWYTLQAVHSQAVYWVTVPDGKANMATWLRDYRSASDSYFFTMASKQDPNIGRLILSIGLDLADATAAVIATYSF